MASRRELNDLVQRIRATRRFGRTTVGFAPNTDSATDLSTALDTFVAKYRMRGLGADWNEISPSDAKRLIVFVLNRDLAYGVECMPVEQATVLATAFLEPFRVGGRFFTNGSFHEKPGIANGASWTPLTEATFDTGVVAVGADWFGVLWVQDED